MKLEIKDEKSLLYISEGDILTLPFSSDNAYLVNFDSFDDVNTALYKLISLSGNNSIFGEKEQSANDIKQLIVDNKLIHYSSKEYLLSLMKKEDNPIQ